MLCPNLANEILPLFGVAPAALSRVGMAENWENGRFLRHRYREFLPEGEYRYDGTFAFFSERVERNVVATASMARGVFPLGTGIEGFSLERPNIVPISTTQDGADVLMNSPRDGPCQRALARDKKAWDQKHEERLYQKHKALFETMSEACGYPLKPGIKYEGKPKSLTWALKSVMDGFTFSANEGFNVTIGGRLTASTIQEFHNVVEGMVADQIFGKKHQITYWTGDFIPTILGLARVPLARPVNKLHVFLNHRELIYSISQMLGMPIEFSGIRKDSLPSGCSWLLEVYDDGIRMYFWAPTRPDTATKAEYLTKKRPITELYSYGSMQPVSAAGCEAGELCPLEMLAFSFVKWVRNTGTYVRICNVSLEERYFAQGEASLGIVEGWVQPDALNTLEHRRDFAPQSPSEEFGLTEADQTALGPAATATLAQEEGSGSDGPRRDDAVGVSSEDVSPLRLAARFGFGATAMSVVSGFVGWRLGRRSRVALQEPVEAGDGVRYVSMS